MDRTKIFALPLHPPDNAEYLKIRRGIEIIGSGSVAYDMPRNRETERLFSDVIGKSGRGLEKEIGAVLRSFKTPQVLVETFICDMIELDSAKRRGLINEVFPVGMDYDTENRQLSDSKIRLTHSHGILMATLENYGSFQDVVKLASDLIMITSKRAETRDAVVMGNVGEAIQSSKGDRMLLMAGAARVPSLERLLSKEGITTVQVESPEKAMGIWWLAHTASAEASTPGEYGADSFGLETIKYALLLSISSIRTASNLSGITKEEEASIRAVTSFEDANLLYHNAQTYYRFEYNTNLPILDIKRD